MLVRMNECTDISAKNMDKEDLNKNVSSTELSIKTIQQ